MALDPAVLCKGCSSITAKPENFQKLFSIQGYKHYRQCDLMTYARSGCSLCQILLEGTSDTPRKARKYHLYLCAWRDDGEGDPVERIKEEDRNIYIHVRVQDYIKLTLSVSAVVDNTAARYIKRRPTPTDVADDTAFEQARKWIDECVNKHYNCPKTQIHTLPTRFLDVGSIHGDEDPRICLNNGNQKGDYVALSYCWGGKQEVVTTMATLKVNMQGVPMRSLPLSIQDAITVSRKLEIRYLWVDALCIIQDSQADKTIEISKMGNIYKNATLTVAAGNTKKASDGFLKPRKQLISSSVPFLCPDGEMGNILISPVPHYNPRKEPLNTRGWTLQEKLLSPRILFYGEKEVSWQCQSQMSKSAAAFHPALTQGLKRLPSYIFNSLEAKPSPGVDDVYNRCLLWMEIVEDYTNRDLSYPEDKLLAILGVASELGNFWKDTYLAGMWRTALVHQLAWMRHRVPSRRYMAPKQYRAPSWSWASIDGPVGMMMLEDVYAELIDCHVKPLVENIPMGQVKDARLVLLAAIAPRNSLSKTPFWTSCVLDVILDADDNTLDSHRESEAETVTLLLLGRTFGSLIGLILTPAAHGMFRRIGKFSLWKEEGQSTDNAPWDGLLEGLERQTVTIV